MCLWAGVEGIPGIGEWESGVGAKWNTEAADPESFGERDFSHTELNVVTSACVE